MSELPMGWVESSVGELFRVAYGKALAEELRIPNGEFAYVGSGGGIARTSQRLVSAETLVIGRKGTAGSVQRYAQGCWPSDTTFFLAMTPELSGRLVELQLRAAQLGQHDRSTAVPGLGRPDLELERLVIPPRQEQERIVAAIEEAFSKLDAGEAGLQKVRQQLNLMRESVLNAAVSGLLVRQVEGDISGEELLMSVGAKLQSIGGLTTLPDGWAWARVGDVLVRPLSNGRSVQTLEGGFPVLRLTCLKNGRIDLGERKNGAWTLVEAERYLVRRGDFLVSRGNGSLTLVGRGGLVEKVPDLVAYPDTLIRVSVDPEVLAPKLLAIWWNSQHIRRQLESLARTTAGIYKVNQSMIEELLLAVPAKQEQTLLVDEIERQFSFIDAAERAVEVGLLRAAALRRTILKAAFEGKLVPQDPTDEPASVLLERIRADRLAADVSKPKETRAKVSK